MKAIKHKWEWVGRWGAFVRCGKCGMNCDSGGYGYANGTTPWDSWHGDERCDACPSAYAMQDDRSTCPLHLRAANWVVMLGYRMTPTWRRVQRWLPFLDRPLKFE